MICSVQKYFTVRLCVKWATMSATFASSSGLAYLCEWANPCVGEWVVCVCAVQFYVAPANLWPTACQSQQQPSRTWTTQLGKHYRARNVARPQPQLAAVSTVCLLWMYTAVPHPLWCVCICVGRLTWTMSPWSWPDAVNVKWHRKGNLFHCGVGTFMAYVRPISP